MQFLEGLFGTLRRAGILQSQRGVKGGYAFARPPDDVTVLEVVELLEGDLRADSAEAGADVGGGSRSRPRCTRRRDDRRGRGARSPGRERPDVLHLKAAAL